MNIPEGVDLRDYIRIVGELEAQEIYSAGAWREPLLKKADGDDDLTGCTLPWGKTFGQFRLRPSEITVLGGMNGHRKSMVTTQMALALAHQGQKIAIASLEMKPVETLWRMCLQSSGISSGRPSKEFINRFTDFADSHVLIYDQLDSVKTEKVLGFVNYVSSELGVQHIFIDSLAKCGIGVENREGEADFINNLAYSAKHLGCHIYLVSHVRKPHSAGEEYIPTKFDVKGNSAIVDLADNLIICWSDKKREGLKLIERDEKQQEYIDKSYDQRLIVAKQRHGAWEGTIGLYSHHSLQFTSRENQSFRYPLEEKWLTDTAKVVHNNQQFPKEEKV